MEKQTLAAVLLTSLSKVTGEELASIGPQVDLINDLGIDSIEFVDLFFKLEHRLQVELDFADLKRLCRAKRKNDMRILFEDVMEYLASRMP